MKKNIFGNVVSDERFNFCHPWIKDQFFEKIKNIYYSKESRKNWYNRQDQNKKSRKKNIFTNYRFYLEVPFTIL